MPLRGPTKNIIKWIIETMLRKKQLYERNSFIPAKSSDKAEALPLFGSFWKFSAFPIYFEILQHFPNFTV